MLYVEYIHSLSLARWLTLFKCTHAQRLSLRCYVRACGFAISMLLLLILLAVVAVWAVWVCTSLRLSRMKSGFRKFRSYRHLMGSKLYVNMCVRMYILTRTYFSMQMRMQMWHHIKVEKREKRKQRTNKDMKNRMLYRT